MLGPEAGLSCVPFPTLSSKVCLALSKLNVNSGWRIQCSRFVRAFLVGDGVPVSRPPPPCRPGAPLRGFGVSVPGSKPCHCAKGMLFPLG